MEIRGDDINGDGTSLNLMHSFFESSKLTLLLCLSVYLFIYYSEDLNHHQIFPLGNC